MSLLLIILAAIGLFIFLISYLKLVVASFKHHPVTGLISLIPGVNLVVLPTILGKTGKTFPASVFGLVLAIIAWYAGGNQYLDNRKNVPLANITEVANPVASRFKEQPLPSKPLYYIVYTAVNTSELESLKNKHIRISLVDDRILEGKNLEANTSSLLLETFKDDTRKVIKVSPKHIIKLEKLERKDRDIL